MNRQESVRYLGRAPVLAMALAWSSWTCSSEDGIQTCVDDPSQLGCAPAVERTEPQNTIRLGLVAPLTGDSSAAGEGLRNGATLAFQEIDWTIGQYRIELVDIDSESANLESGAIAEKYRTAIDDNQLVAALLNWHSSVSVALMDVAADAGMAHLFPFGATDEVNSIYASDPVRYSVWVAKGWPQPGTYVSSYLDLMQCLLSAGCEEARAQTAWQPTNTSLFIATEPGSWGDAFEAGAREKIDDPSGWWAANGWEVAGALEVRSDDDATSLSSKAGTVANAEASVLLMTSTADNVGQFVEQVRSRMDPDPLIIVEGLGWTAASLTSAGRSAVGVLDGGFGPYNGDEDRQQAVARFQEAYEIEFGEAPSTSSGGLAYDYTRFAIEVLRRTLEENGQIDRAGVLSVYADQVGTGALTFDDGVVMGRYAYSSTTAPDPLYGQGYYYFPVYQYQDPDRDGQVDFLTVFPSELRDGDVVVP